MATEQRVANITYQASADYREKQYFLMKRHTVREQCVIVGAVVDWPIGILQNKPDSGQAAEIMTLGRSKAQVEATTDIAIGDLLGPHTDGRLIKKSADGDLVCAIAEEAATAATGTVITVTLFEPSRISVPT